MQPTTNKTIPCLPAQRSVADNKQAPAPSVPVPLDPTLLQQIAGGASSPRNNW